MDHLRLPSEECRKSDLLFIKDIRTNDLIKHQKTLKCVSTPNQVALNIAQTETFLCFFNMRIIDVSGIEVISEKQHILLTLH